MTVTEAELHERILRKSIWLRLEVQTEAWADGISEGVDPEIMADGGNGNYSCPSRARLRR